MRSRRRQQGNDDGDLCRRWLLEKPFSYTDGRTEPEDGVDLVYAY